MKTTSNEFKEIIFLELIYIKRNRKDEKSEPHLEF